MTSAGGGVGPLHEAASLREAVAYAMSGALSPRGASAEERAAAVLWVVGTHLHDAITALPIDPMPDGYISSREFKRQVLVVVAALLEHPDA